jgi:hypothetical protein
MNVPRRIAALKRREREIRYGQNEIERMAALRAAKEEAVIASHISWRGTLPISGLELRTARPKSVDFNKITKRN